MKPDDPKVKDPVCGMMVPAGQYAIGYLGREFAFCSRQCRENFLATPHLYIGTPGHRAPKQDGVEVVKRRRFRLGEPLSPQQARHVEDEVRAMMGIRDIVIDGDSIEISYDLLQVTAEQLEAQLEALGAGLGHDLAQRLRLAFVHYLEETEARSLESPDSSHHHH